MPVSTRLSRQALTIALDCLLVFLIVAALLWPLFGAGFFDNWGSIESTFIAQGRFLKEHGPRPLWQPLWYGGTRMDYPYPPAIGCATAAVSKLLDLEPVRAYHVYIAFFFAAGIAGVYLLARLGTRSRGAAWLAALSTALLSPSYLLLPSVRADGFHFAPWRLHVMVQWGEGPHMTALALLGFALLASFYALRDGKPALIALAALFSALAVSHNLYGATALAFFFPPLCWAVWVTQRGWAPPLRAAAIAGLAYGLTAWWLAPSTLRVTAGNMKLFSPPGNSWSWVVALAVGAGFAWLTNRFARGRRDMAYTVFVWGACLFYCLNVLGGHYFGFRMVGEPSRLAPEMDLAIILAAVEVLRRLWDPPVPFRTEWLKTRPYVPRLLAVVLVLLAFSGARHYLRRPWLIYRTDPQYRARVEYRVQDWIAKNMPEARTAVFGSTRYWFNVWNDLAQVGGGSDWGLLNPTIFSGMWQLILGDQPEPGILWMQAMGIDAIVTHGPRSPELYHDLKYWNKFAGALPAMFDDGRDTVIYRVPRRYPGLARVVDRERLVALPVYREGMDQVANLKPYVALVEHGPDSPASFRWEGTDAMRIHARVNRGEAVLVQATYDPAWRAYSAGRLLAVRKDPFGQILVETPPGEHDLRLAFEMPLENRIGLWLAVLSLFAVMEMLLRDAVKPFHRRFRSHRPPVGAPGSRQAKARFGNG